MIGDLLVFFGYTVVAQWYDGGADTRITLENVFNEADTNLHKHESLIYTLTFMTEIRVSAFFRTILTNK